MMLKYNICFIKRGQDILLLNRNAPSWMGCWNGIGGKLEEREEPRASMFRELYEETNIRVKEGDLHFKGIITWTVDGARFGGMYTYLAELPVSFEYETPLKTEEGILDWKAIGWILDEHNVGIASNIPHTLNPLLYDKGCYRHHCTYIQGRLARYEATPLDPRFETDEAIRESLMGAYR